MNVKTTSATVLAEYVERGAIDLEKDGFNPATDCAREDCVITVRGSSTTLLGWMKTYDKYGNLIGKDPNTTTTHYRCNTCGKDWITKS